MKTDAILDRMKSLFRIITLVVVLTLSACTSQSPPPATLVPAQSPGPGTNPTATLAKQPSQSPIASQTAVAMPSSTVGQSSAPTITVSAGSIPQGVTPEGYFFLGREDAPNTIVMYSDTF